MSGYARYQYYGSRPTAHQREKGTWSSFLEPRLWQIAPSAGPPKEARMTALRPLPVSPLAFLWNAVFMGYGLPAHYVSLFLLDGHKMTPAQVEQFREWIVLRACALAASHDISVVKGVTHVARKDIYSLIESSEATWAGYLVGNAFAQVCVPLHLKRQLAKKGKKAAIAPILYHASLLEKAAAIGIKISYADKSTVDLIAFDSWFDMHFVEAKGDSGIYSAWIKSIYQCMGVLACSFDGITWSAPASLTSSVAFAASHAVPCGTINVGPGMRAVLTDIPLARMDSHHAALRLLQGGLPPPAGPAETPDAGDDHNRVACSLAGFRLLATCFVVDILDTQTRADWTISRFATRAGSDWVLEAAMPNPLLQMARHLLRTHEQFRPPAFVREIDIERLGRGALAWLRNSRIAPPPGFQWTASDPFLALPSIPEDAARPARAS